MRCNYIFCDGPKACASRNDGRPLRPCWTVTERPRRCITEYGVRTARPPYSDRTRTRERSGRGRAGPTTPDRPPNAELAVICRPAALPPCRLSVTRPLANARHHHPTHHLDLHHPFDLAARRGAIIRAAQHAPVPVPGSCAARPLTRLSFLSPATPARHSASPVHARA